MVPLGTLALMGNPALALLTPYLNDVGIIVALFYSLLSLNVFFPRSQNADYGAEVI